jgi:hypothetical protein
MRVINLPKENDVFIVSDRQYFFLKEHNIITEDNNELESTHSRKSIMTMIDMIPKTYRMWD